MNDVRAAISLMRDAMVPDQKAYGRLIQLHVDGYQEMRLTGEQLRNKIRRMNGGGVTL
jgi:hypothetical protein